MAEGLDEKALLIKVVMIQRQMIEDLHTLNSQFRIALQTLCGLDPAFKEIYFAKVLATESDDLPTSIPDRETLSEALRFLGWTPAETPEINYWCTFHNHVPNPWEQSLSERSTLPRGRVITHKGRPLARSVKHA